MYKLLYIVFCLSYLVIFPVCSYAQKTANDVKAVDNALEKEMSDASSSLSSISELNKRFQQKDQVIKKLTQELVKNDKQIKELKKQIDDLELRAEKQESFYMQAITQKDAEYQHRISKMSETYTAKVTEYEQKLNEKYKQLDNALKVKNSTYDKELLDKEKELTLIREQLEEKITVLRQLIAKKEIEFNQKLQEQKDDYGENLTALKKSSEQLRMYLVKLKEDLRLKEIVIKEKDDNISVLNKKIALFSGEEVSYKKKISELMREDLIALKSENNRLKKEQEKIKNAQIEAENEYENKLAQQQSRILRLQRESELNLVSNSSAWRDKIQEIESGYITQYQELEQNNEQIKDKFEQQLAGLKTQLQEKVKENEKLKYKLNSFYSNPSHLLEDMLATRSTKRKETGQAITQTPDFKGEKKEKARDHFTKAMDAIVKKKYAEAKRELEQVLLLEPDSQMAISTLGHLTFLMEKKQ